MRPLKKVDRLSIWFPAFLLAIMAGLTAWIDHKAQPTEIRDGKLRHDPDYMVDNLAGTRFGPDGYPRYTLFAVHLEHFPDDDSTDVTQPRFEHFSRGKPPIVATADRANVSSKGDDVYLYDHVKLTRAAYDDQSALTVETTYLHLVPDDHIAETDKPVKIYNANAIVTAVGLKFDNESQVLDLRSNVQTRYVPTPRQ